MASYDSVLQVIGFQEKEHVVLGVEYATQTNRLNRLPNKDMGPDERGTHRVPYLC